MKPTSIEDFYNDCQRRTKFDAFRYDEYGRQRKKDCNAAEAIGLYRKVKLSHPVTFQNGTEHLAKFDWIYNPPDSPLDARCIVAPDTRVPNYSTCIRDALALAIKLGLKTLPVPSVPGSAGEQELCNYIISKIP